jgi:RNA polymerase sigma-70 factor, ECF subfamily
MDAFPRSPSMRRQRALEASPARALVGPEPGAADVVSGRDESLLPPFVDFYLREFPRLTVLARALVGPEHAEDVAQEALLVAYRRWMTIGAMTSPGGYVRGICVHKATTVARRRTLEKQTWRRLGARRTGVLTEDDLSDESRQFWALIRSLPRRQAQAAALHYALDMSVAEIAVVLDCAEGTVKAHLFRARNALAAAFVIKGEPS